MKTILAIETSTAACSVALSHQGQLFQIFEMLPQRHAHRILEMVDEILQQQQLSGSDIDYLAFGEGPGAFTGIRIATGVIQGLALGWNKPVIAVSSLEAMAYDGLQQGGYLDKPSQIDWAAIMDARMQEIYLQTGSYNTDTQQWEANAPQLLNEQTIKECLAERQAEVFGDVQNAYPELVSELTSWHESLPSAKAVAQLALKRTESAKSIQEQVPLPVYLRNNVAETIAERKAKQAQ